MKHSAERDRRDPEIEDRVTGDVDDALVAKRAEETQRFAANDARRANENKPERETHATSGACAPP
jgi:hypothetical protein